jgi:hypothetical protein
MGVSFIDGTLEEVHLKTARRNLRIYKALKFRLADGRERTEVKAVVDAEVAALLLPGTTGRFYLYRQIDHGGIHGVRTSDGQAIHKFPKNNELAMVAVGVIGLFLLVLNLSMDRLSIWGVLCVLLGFPGYFLYRGTRLSAGEQFAADDNYRPPAAATPATV